MPAASANALKLLAPEAIMARLEALIAEHVRLLNNTGLSPAEVHEVRVNGKKLRSWIRLNRLGGAHQRCRKADHWLRAISRSLAAGRDAQVTTATLARLGKRTAAATTAAALALLADPLRAVTTAPLPDGADSTDAQRQLRCLAALWPDARELRHGLRAVYARARRLATRATAPEAQPTDLHHCRKWVKYLGFQLELATGTSGKKGAPLQRTLAGLGTTLGNIQDLVVLGQHLDALETDIALAEAVGITRKLQQASSKRLINKATRELSTCFAPTPKQFAATLE
jgi:CHAD domain-containing protein